MLGMVMADLHSICCPKVQLPWLHLIFSVTTWQCTFIFVQEWLWGNVTFPFLMFQIVDNEVFNVPVVVIASDRPHYLYRYVLYPSFEIYIVGLFISKVIPCKIYVLICLRCYYCVIVFRRPDNSLWICGIVLISECCVPYCPPMVSIQIW